MNDKQRVVDRLTGEKFYNEIIRGNIKIVIQESGEAEPLGIILDVYNTKKDVLIQTETYWYEDFE